MVQSLFGVIPFVLFAMAFGEMYFTGELDELIVHPAG
jgi:hypothetical protein